MTNVQSKFRSEDFSIALRRGLNSNDLCFPNNIQIGTSDPEFFFLIFVSKLSRDDIHRF